MEFTRNGQLTHFDSDPEMAVLAYLREVARLISPKDGCSGEGVCGCCTVLVDGASSRSCRLQMKELAGRTLTTAEGLSARERDVFADAFVAKGGVQCGFCTPGIVMQAKAMLARNPNPTRDEIAGGLSGHICRCTGYKKVIDSIECAAEALREAIRIPADYVDKPVDQGGDPACGTSNHEFPRLDYLRRKIVAIKAVRRDEDAYFDAFGNLVWRVEDPHDGIPSDQKKVIYIDGHTDTVKPLRAQWLQHTGGIDYFDGILDATKVNKAFLHKELGYLPPECEWHHLIFGRGSADQLGGVIAAAIATKLLLELEAEGALRGVIVYSYATVCEEDNDGAGPMYLNRAVFPTAAPAVVPDVVILTDSSGCSKNCALGIYRGQRGRMQIEVAVTGKSCHGSMPWEGKNPLEFGGAILKEAADQYGQRIGFKEDPFLGHGTCTASWARPDTPSDCAVPEKFTFRFDRRLTIGETPEQCCAAVEALVAVAAARKAGLIVEISIPTYTDASWKGYVLNNDEIAVARPCIDAADETYNCEWSQELKLEESFTEYLNGWVLIHALAHKLGLKDPGTHFSMSVGYNLEGIQHPRVQKFIADMRDAGPDLAAAIDIVAKVYPGVRNIHIPSELSNQITLSTMHGCPPAEIERIATFLLTELGVHTWVKLNPTLLGPERLRGLLNGTLGFDITVPDEAFGHDRKWDDALAMVKRLAALAEGRANTFGLKLSNSLEVVNHRPVFPTAEKMIYLSGRALHPLTLTLAHLVVEETGGRVPISFCGGADPRNFAWA